MALGVQLVACPACARHAFSRETQCPSCGEPLRAPDGSIPRTAGAVMLGLSLTLVGAAACGPSVSESTGGSTATGHGGQTASNATSAATGHGGQTASNATSTATGLGGHISQPTSSWVASSSYAGPSTMSTTGWFTSSSSSVTSSSGAGGADGGEEEGGVDAGCGCGDAGPE
jgi:hypothetical protein